MTPQQLWSIYDLNPVLDDGIDGAGQSLGVFTRVLD